MGIGAALNAGHSTTSHGSIASAMGSLNASHASLNAMSHAAPTSTVGMIGSYRGAMVTAIGMPTATPAQVAARNAAIASARADVLGPAANKELTPSVVSAVDKQLGLPATNPNLGVSQPSRY
jgi:hypothetical protein